MGPEVKKEMNINNKALFAMNVYIYFIWEDSYRISSKVFNKQNYSVSADVSKLIMHKFCFVCFL